MAFKVSYTKTLCSLASGQIKLGDLLESLKTTKDILQNARITSKESVERILNSLACQSYFVESIKKELQELTELLQKKMPTV